MKNNRLIFEKIELINQKGDAEVNNDMEMEAKEKPRHTVYKRFFKDKSGSGDNKKKLKSEFPEPTPDYNTLKIPNSNTNMLRESVTKVKNPFREFGDRYMFKTNHTFIMQGGGAPNGLSKSTIREAAKKETKKAKKSEQGMFVFKLTHFIKKFKESSESFRFRNISTRALRIINDLSNGVRKPDNDPDFEADQSMNNKEKYSKIVLRSIKLFMKKIYRFFIYFFPKCQVINPNDWFKFVWDLISLVVLSAFYIYLPMQISFMPLTAKRVYVDTAIFIFLVIDILLTLNTGIFINGIIIVKKIRIRKHYMKRFFLADFLALLPFLIGFVSNQDDLMYQLLVFFKFSQFLNNLNLIKDHVESLLQGDESIEGIFSLIKLILTILFIAHLLCCIFHFIAFSKTGCLGDTWLAIKNLEDAEWGERYLYSIYWSLVTMITVGYGDITPQNSKEVLFTCCAMLIGCGTFAYSINVIGIYIQKIGRRHNEFKKKLKSLNRYMNLKNIDTDLQIKVRKYMEFVWGEEANIDEETEIINKLSASLRREFYSNSTGKILNNIDLFKKNFSRQFICAISEKMKLVKFSPEDVIYKEGEMEDNDLYILLSGCVNITFSILKRGETIHNIMRSIKLLNPFGEYSFITGTSRRATARSEGFTSAYVLKREDFLECLKKFPIDYESFCYIRDNIRVNEITSQLHIECSSCSQLDHNFVDCRYIQHKPFKSQIIAKHIYSPFQRRASKLRREQRNQCPLLLLRDLEPINLSFQRKFAGRIRALLKQINSDNLYDDDEDDEEEEEEEEKEINDEETKKREMSSGKIPEKLTGEDMTEVDLNANKDMLEILLKNSEDNKARKKSVVGRELSNRLRERNNLHSSTYRKKKIISVYENRSTSEYSQNNRPAYTNEEALTKLASLGRENRRHSSRKLNISINQQETGRINALFYEALRSFRKYFPYNNAEHVIEKMKRQKRRRREAEIKFLKNKS